VSPDLRLTAALDAVAAAGHRTSGGGTTATCGRTTGVAGLHDLEAVVVETGHHDGDVRGALLDATGAATSTRGEPLERRALVGVAGEDEQFVGVLLIVVDGVGDGRGQHLAHHDGGLAVGELQHLVGLLHGQAANQVEHDPHLRRRHADVLGAGLRARTLAGDEGLLVELGTSHQRRPFAFFSWPAWYLKVRVGLNSPSL
jgi:hypothetical protein